MTTGSQALLAATLVAALVSGCTVTSVGAEDAPPRIESRGLIDGHAAIGVRAEDEFFRLRVLDGESDGALGGVVLWKLFRLEVGALGFGVGLGPFDLALGTLFFEPEVPPMGGKEREASAPATATDCATCAEAKGG
ncbi:MAG: hypothetical protein HOP15_06900 [Planctomycetes bacterium]|nr:hypothetical protein [Planctomycetota bacterium]